MATELRKTGISVVGDIPWGTHFCHFYDTKQDLLDILVPYFKAGLESKEFCLWVVSDSDLITVEEAKGSLAQAVPDLDRHLTEENIEILRQNDWYFEEHALNLERAKHGWDAKLKLALAQGYEGLRASADTFWLAEKDWKDFFDYEQQINDWITNQSMTVMCTYPLAKSGATEVLDVVQAHQFAIARRQGEWQLVETPELIQAKAEIKRLNEDLEQTVVERTGQLAAAVEELEHEIANRAKSEAELGLAHQRLSYHIENTPLGVIEFDKDWFIKRWSKRAEEIFGWKTSEAIGKNVYDPDFPIIYGEDVPAVDKINEQLKTGTVAGNLSINRNYAKDGSVIYSEWYNSVLKDESGNVITILSLVHDVTERKRDEDDLRKQKEILQKIVDHIPVMINFTDRQGWVKLVNREWQKTIGWSLEEIRNENIDVFAKAYPDPKYRKEVLEFLEAATGEWTDFKTRIRDGSVIDTSWACVRLSDGSTIGIGQNITERRRADQSIRLFRTLIDQTSDAISVIDSDTLRFLDCNESAYQNLGYSREEFLSLTVYDIDPRVNEGLLSRLLEEMNRSGSVVFESVHQRKDGSTFPVEINLKTISLEKDYNLAVVRDITERKQAEDALRTSEDRLRLVIDTTPMMAWSIRPDGVVDFLNQRWIDYTGLSLEQYIKDPTGPVHPDDISGVMDNWLVSMAEGKESEEELRLRRADGEYRWFLVRTSPLKDEQGNVVKWYGVSVDIEDRKRVEDRLRETTRHLRALSARFQSAKDEEGARIAREIHDELGAVLTSLRWDLEGFDKAISESGDQSQAEEVRARIGDMLTLIETAVSTVRRISSELRPTVLDDLGLAEAIESQTEQFQARTGIVCHCDCSLQNLNLNREQSTAVFRIFQEALTNILRHAQATSVDIVLKTEAGEFTMTISDNGRGITTAEKSGPQSLGLLGMQERADLIGGTIKIRGIKGKGTVVTVRVPISG